MGGQRIRRAGIPSTAAAFGQNALVLAPLSNNGQIRSFSRFLENALQCTRKFGIIDRERVEDILREHGFQLSDLADSRKTAELGKLLNANFLVRPLVMPLAGGLFLESRWQGIGYRRGQCDNQGYTAQCRCRGKSLQGSEAHRAG
jgi:hypothetical protein